MSLRLEAAEAEVHDLPCGIVPIIAEESHSLPPSFYEDRPVRIAEHCRAMRSFASTQEDLELRANKVCDRLFADQLRNWTKVRALALGMQMSARKTCKEVTWCEIDGDVVDAAKQFMPSVAKAIGNPKVELLVGDGVAFAEKSKDNSFDVIIVDSSDPVGPAEKLFSKEFYVNAERILKPGGVICSQGECLWLNEELIATMVQDYGACFASAEYATIQASFQVSISARTCSATRIQIQNQVHEYRI
ncbi:Spermidine synthase 1 (SPDSY 1) (Putrescine aminopropyltransferase 1) [Durusdinium trenchii]|uniref:Spermidine synthase 1 (SPDSY 1) (Putrescine aminopropyltransferase 1) n=1 Tax=Durusdinium trenchii TaxID=1381693 RepID=A0ABP0RZU0_9DINO